MFCDRIVMKLFVSYDRRFVLTFVYWYYGIWVLFIKIVYT